MITVIAIIRRQHGLARSSFVLPLGEGGKLGDGPLSLCLLSSELGDLLHILVGCPKARSGSVIDRCKAVTGSRFRKPTWRAKA